MDPFERKIRKTLSKAPDREPDPSIWDVINRKLPPSGRGSLNWLRYATISGLLLALAGLIFIAGKNYLNFNKNLQHQIAEMAKEIQDLKNTLTDTIVIRDTVWQIYHPSGMVEDKAHRQQKFNLTNILTGPMNAIPGYPDKAPFPTSSLSLLLWDPITHAFSDNKRYLIVPSASRNLLPNKTEREHDLTSITQIQPRDFNPFYSIRRNIQLHPYRGLYAEDIIKARRMRRLGQALWPDQVRLGVLTGAFNPVVHEVEHTTEWLVGAQAELLFSSRFSLMTGLRYRYFSTKYEHELEEEKFPDPNGILPGDRVREIYLTNRYQDFPVLLKYSLPLSGHFWPYLTAGLMWSNARSQKLRYEVIRQGDEIDLSTTIPPGGWHLGSYLIGAGIEYIINPRLTSTIDLEGRYNFHLSASEFQKFHGMGIRVGLYYSVSGR